MLLRLELLGTGQNLWTLITNRFLVRETKKRGTMSSSAETETFVCTACKLDKHLKCAVVQEEKGCTCQDCVSRVRSRARTLMLEADQRYAKARKS